MPTGTDDPTCYHHDWQTGPQQLPGVGPSVSECSVIGHVTVTQVARKYTPGNSTNITVMNYFTGHMKISGTNHLYRSDPPYVH